MTPLFALTLSMACSGARARMRKLSVSIAESEVLLSRGAPPAGWRLNRAWLAIDEAVNRKSARKLLR